MIVVGVIASEPVVRLGLTSAVSSEPSWRVGLATATTADFVEAIESHSCAVVIVATGSSESASTAVDPLVARGFSVVTWGGDPDAGRAAGASRSVTNDAATAELRAAIIDAFAERPGANSFCVSQLTTRQLEVLVLVGGGLANKQIAQRLDVSMSTVKRHMEQLMERTGRRSRAELAVLAADLGALRPETLTVLDRAGAGDDVTARSVAETRR